MFEKEITYKQARKIFAKFGEKNGHLKNAYNIEKNSEAMLERGAKLYRTDKKWIVKSYSANEWDIENIKTYL